MQSDPPPPAGNNLHGLRVEIAHRAHARGLLALQGKGWPAEYEAEDTGWSAESAGAIREPWSAVKLRWLQGYWFNLAYENTLAPHYVTEKIWHAVLAGCVPVYYGANSTIFEDFPEGSFVDGSRYPTPDALLDALATMTEAEALDRVHFCTQAVAIALMNKVVPLRVTDEERSRRFMRLMRRRSK